MKVSFVNKTIRELIFRHIQEKLGNGVVPNPDNLVIEVQSNQNYRVHEWEKGELSGEVRGGIVPGPTAGKGGTSVLWLSSLL